MTDDLYEKLKKGLLENFNNSLSKTGDYHVAQNDRAAYALAVAETAKALIELEASRSKKTGVKPVL